MPGGPRAQPSPHPAAHGLTDLSHTFISFHCCSTVLELALWLLSPSSCAGSCLSLFHAPQLASPPLLCAPLSCNSQQHPNKPLREQPVYRPVTSSSAPASPARPPPWAASALDMCFWLGCAKGVLGGCAAPFHADPCHLCEPSPAMGEWGRIVVVPGTWCRSNWQGQEGSSTVPAATGGMDCGALGRAQHLPFPATSWKITQGPQGRKS